VVDGIDAKTLRQLAKRGYDGDAGLFVDAQIKTMAAELLELRNNRPDSSQAMTWQEEPSEHGWYWIEGGGPRYAWCDKAGTWWLKGAGGDRRLNGRRVCRIPDPPKLPKGGAS